MKESNETEKPPGYDLCCETFDDEGRLILTQEKEWIYERVKIAGFATRPEVTAYTKPGNHGNYRPSISLNVASGQSSPVNRAFLLFYGDLDPLPRPLLYQNRIFIYHPAAEFGAILEALRDAKRSGSPVYCSYLFQPQFDKVTAGIYFHQRL